MGLPVSNLDDRTFQDLVREARAMIPHYCPEWTDHDLSDPGITLIELFAWMVHQVHGNDRDAIGTNSTS